MGLRRLLLLWLLCACQGEGPWSGTAPRQVLLLAGVWVTPEEKSQGCHRGEKRWTVPYLANPSPLTPQVWILLRKPVSLCPNWEAGEMVWSLRALAGHVHGPNTQCPSDLRLGAGGGFLNFFFVCFSLLKKNLGFISWKWSHRITDSLSWETKLLV